MLNKRLMKKMFITSSIVTILLLIYFMPSSLGNNFKTSVEYVDLINNIVYLVDDDGLLVETSVSMVDDNNIESKIKSLINHLSDASNEIIPNGLNHVLRDDISLIDVFVDENIAFLNFSKEILELKDKELIRLIEAVSYTVLNVSSINGVGI